jgi:hypothetical protein
LRSIALVALNVGARCIRGATSLLTEDGSALIPVGKAIHDYVKCLIDDPIQFGAHETPAGD